MQIVRKNNRIYVRAYERVPFAHKLTIMDLNTGEKFPGAGIDISIMGMGFFSKKFLPKNTRVAIQVWLDNVSHEDPKWIYATVRWSKLEQDGAVMGVQFDNLIKPTEHPKLYEIIYKTEG